MSQITQVANTTPKPETTTKRRPGRPKGSKNKATLEKEAKLKEAAAVKIEEAKKAAEEILAEKEPEIKLQADQPFEGNPAKTDAATHPGQRDHLPGSRFTDKLYVPDKAYDSELNTVRTVALRSEYHYVWVYPELISSFKNRGYRQCKYSGGSLSGLAERGFKGTDMFEATLDGHVRNGDIILMFIGIRGYEEAVEDERKFIDDRNMAVSTQMHDTGYHHGIRTHEEVDGKEVHN